MFINMIFEFLSSMFSTAKFALNPLKMLFQVMFFHCYFG